MTTPTGRLRVVASTPVSEELIDEIVARGVDIVVFGEGAAAQKRNDSSPKVVGSDDTVAGGHWLARRLIRLTLKVESD